MPAILLLFIWIVLAGLARADSPTDPQPIALPGGNMDVDWDVKAERSPSDYHRWYVYIVMFVNRYPDSQRLVSVLGTDWSYFYVLNSADDVTAFNSLMLKAAQNGWTSLPDTELLCIPPGRIRLGPDGKGYVDNKDYYITEPLKVYDRWVAQANEQHLVGVRKRIPGDLTVSFDIDTAGNPGLFFPKSRLDAEAVERLRNCPQVLTAIAELRLLPRIRLLTAAEKKAQQAQTENNQKADLLK